MTKDESARIVASKEGPCMACLVRVQQGLQDYPMIGCDYHHTKSGNMRRGHMFGFGLCCYHHRSYPILDTVPLTRDQYGPSLMDGGKTFRNAYGTDDELIELQSQTIRGNT